MRCLSTAAQAIRPCSACRGRVPDNCNCATCGGSGVVRYTHGKPVILAKRKSNE